MSELQTVGANVPDIVRQLIKSCNAMKEPSLTAFLPLLRFEGHPYNLKFHFQLEPLYRLCFPRRTVLMTGRQVGKSQGLVSSTVLRCGLIPNFHVLICEPQFMQIRQISNITFRNMVAQSYISNYLIGPNCNNSMLIREFTSGSRANFMYIGGGADRARGLAGVKMLIADESVVSWESVFVYDTMLQKFVQVPISQVKKGDLVASFDFSGKACILISVVKRDASYHGKRSCFKVTTEAGRTITCTADHLFPTSIGKKRLSEVIRYEFERRSKSNWDVRNSVKCIDGRTTRRRLSRETIEQGCSSKISTLCETERLCDCQVPTITRIRYQGTIREEELRLRKQLIYLQNEEPWNVALIAAPSLPKWEEEWKGFDKGVSRPIGSSNSSSLVVPGRWNESKTRKQGHSLYKCLQEGRSRNDQSMDDGTVGNYNSFESDNPYIIWQEIVDITNPKRRFLTSVRTDFSIHSRLYEIQDKHLNDDLSCMWETIYPSEEEEMFTRVRCNICEGESKEQLSRENRYQKGAAKEIQRRTQGKDCSTEEGLVQTLLGESYRGRESSFQSKEESRERGKTLRCCKRSSRKGETESSLVIDKERSRKTGEEKRSLEEVLSRTEGRSCEVGKTSGKTENKESSKETTIITGKPGQFYWDRIKSVEYVGEEDVYDIEVEGTHSYILASSLLSGNCDDMEIDVINIVAETMSAVKEGGTYLFTGTPKLTDGTLPYYFNKSSGGEVTIKCEHCNKVNIASIEFDLLKMIGKTTCICAKCGKPLDVRKCYYSFRRPELRATFDGFHMSQVTHPLHCTSPVKWREFLGKLEQYPQAQAWNELLGEPCDSSTRIITRGDLENATTGLNNDYSVAISNSQHYGQLVLGIDWGGYGIEGESFTVMAVVGLRPMERKLEVLYLEKIPTGKKHEEQVARAVSLAEEFHCTAIAHDGTGAGAIKEEMLNQEMKGEGILTVPLVYMWAPRQDALRYMEPNNGHAGYYALDKTRSLALTIGAIKAKQLLLPNYKSCSSLLDDFLALGEDIRSTQNSGEIRIITRMGTHPDDTAHAINLAANALWHMNKCRPDLGSMVNKYENQPDWASEGSEMQL